MEKILLTIKNMILFLNQLEYQENRFGFNICHNKNQDFVVASYETSDPKQSFKVLATSKEPWAVKFREHLKNVHGLDIVQSLPQINELVVNWEE